MRKVQKASSQFHSREKEAEHPKTPDRSHRDLEAWLLGNDRKSYPQLDLRALLSQPIVPLPEQSDLSGIMFYHKEQVKEAMRYADCFDVKIREMIKDSLNKIISGTQVLKTKEDIFFHLKFLDVLHPDLKTIIEDETAPFLPPYGCIDKSELIGLMVTIGERWAKETAAEVKDTLIHWTLTLMILQGSFTQEDLQSIVNSISSEYKEKVTFPNLEVEEDSGDVKMTDADDTPLTEALAYSACFDESIREMIEKSLKKVASLSGQLTKVDILEHLQFITHLFSELGEHVQVMMEADVESYIPPSGSIEASELIGKLIIIGQKWIEYADGERRDVICHWMLTLKVLQGSSSPEELESMANAISSEYKEMVTLPEDSEIDKERTRILQKMANFCEFQVAGGIEEIKQFYYHNRALYFLTFPKNKDLAHTFFGEVLPFSIKNTKDLEDFIDQALNLTQSMEDKESQEAAICWLFGLTLICYRDYANMRQDAHKFILDTDLKNRILRAIDEVEEIVQYYIETVEEEEIEVRIDDVTKTKEYQTLVQLGGSQFAQAFLAPPQADKGKGKEKAESFDLQFIGQESFDQKQFDPVESQVTYPIFDGFNPANANAKRALLYAEGFEKSFLRERICQGIEILSKERTKTKEDIFNSNGPILASLFPQLNAIGLLDSIIDELISPLFDLDKISHVEAIGVSIKLAGDMAGTLKDCTGVEISKEVRDRLLHWVLTLKVLQNSSGEDCIETVNEISDEYKETVLGEYKAKDGVEREKIESLYSFVILVDEELRELVLASIKEMVNFHYNPYLFYFHTFSSNSVLAGRLFPDSFQFSVKSGDELLPLIEEAFNKAKELESNDRKAAICWLVALLLTLNSYEKAHLYADQIPDRDLKNEIKNRIRDISREGTKVENEKIKEYLA